MAWTVTMSADFKKNLLVVASLTTALTAWGRAPGRGAADLFFFGSTTHHVIREARCAALTLRE
jgi:nucleotide-binding universal stress UspA family protein